MELGIKGRKVAILATDGVEQVELVEPRKALDAAGAETHLIAPKEGAIQGMNHDDKGDMLAVDRALSQVRASDYDALLLPGGVKNPDTLRTNESAVQFVREFMLAEKPVAAICHGVLVAARSKRADGNSVLHGHTTTCLPKYMERAAYLSTFWKLGRYYRTYPAYVEDEVRAALEDPRAQFERGPVNLTKRGTGADDSPAFTVTDGRYVSARWPGDAYLIAEKLIARLTS